MRGEKHRTRAASDRDEPRLVSWPYDRRLAASRLLPVGLRGLISRASLCLPRQRAVAPPAPASEPELSLTNDVALRTSRLLSARFQHLRRKAACLLLAPEEHPRVGSSCLPWSPRCWPLGPSQRRPGTNADNQQLVSRRPNRQVDGRAAQMLARAQRSRQLVTVGLDQLPCGFPTVGQRHPHPRRGVSVVCAPDRRRITISQSHSVHGACGLQGCVRFETESRNTEPERSPRPNRWADDCRPILGSRQSELGCSLSSSNGRMLEGGLR
jgi:hypothetical protein